ncbi:MULTISPECIES: type 1 glutamine amidotransferase [unclassified Saccharicrinis]|uniref:type 1 glutamine amidotransferase n=1 Tax=unclassified Saccharicrinis TaxID=2646859 RepID=UPI003D33141F
MHIHWIQHVPFEGLGNIEEWVITNNHQLTCTKQFNNDALPSLNSFDMLIIMGGPMGVYDTDKYPWLAEELEFIKSAIEADKAVLGICLGSQFMAASTGASVYPGPMKEIGWFPINIVSESAPFNFESSRPTVFHWHGDTFDLPTEAVHLASTDEVASQAFMIGNKAIGLQFHLEQTEKTISGMVENCGQELVQGKKKIQMAEEIINEKAFFAENKKAMFGILDYLSH